MDHHEIVRIIFDYLVISDQRMCTYTCKSYQNLCVREADTKLQKVFAHNFMSHLPFVRRTLEFLYYGYHYLVPNCCKSEAYFTIYLNDYLYDHCVEQKYDATINFMLTISFCNGTFCAVAIESIQKATAKHDRFDMFKWTFCCWI